MRTCEDVREAVSAWLDGELDQELEEETLAHTSECEDCRFSTWVFRLTYNTCLDALRRRQRGQVLSLTREDDGDGERQAEVLDPSPGPEEALLKKERAEILRREMEKLSEKLRAPLVMRELGGCSYEEIANALGISVGTVKSRIARARENLAEALVREGTFPGRTRQKSGKGGDRI